MSRLEFTNKTKLQAWKRANGQCQKCDVELKEGNIHYDHITPCGNGGNNSLDNCMVLCRSCHGVKTASKDMPSIAKTKRIERKHLGIKKPSRLSQKKVKKGPGPKELSLRAWRENS